MDTDCEKMIEQIEDSRVEAQIEARQLRDELESVRRELHRFQHGEEIEGDYVCKAGAELASYRQRLEKAILETKHRYPDDFVYVVLDYLQQRLEST